MFGKFVVVLHCYETFLKKVEKKNQKGFEPWDKFMRT